MAENLLSYQDNTPRTSRIAARFYSSPAHAARPTHRLRHAFQAEHAYFSGAKRFVSRSCQSFAGHELAVSRPDSPHNIAQCRRIVRGSTIVMEPVDPDLLPPGFRYEVQKTVTATDLYLWARLMGE